MPVLPAFNDTDTAHKFFSSLTSLVNGTFWLPPPLEVDYKMFVTFGLGLVPCESNASCAGPKGQRFAASMNNESFRFPTKMSMLEAFYNNVDGIYTTDFPTQPPLVFDYTNASNTFNMDLLMTKKSTSVTKLKFNSTVEIVLQNTAMISLENHPIHLHGFSFSVLAQGFGNYDSVNDAKKFNLVNPQIGNTIAVPVGGWAVIRFQANNPGAFIFFYIFVLFFLSSDDHITHITLSFHSYLQNTGVWLMHCHLDEHMSWGLTTAFVVENGPTPSSTLPPPPPDLPKC